MSIKYGLALVGLLICLTACQEPSNPPEAPVQIAPDTTGTVQTGADRFSDRAEARSPGDLSLTSDQAGLSLTVACSASECEMFLSLPGNNRELISQPLPVNVARPAGEIQLSQQGPDDLMRGPETADLGWRFGDGEQAVDVFVSPFGGADQPKFIVEQRGGFEHIASAFAVLVVEADNSALTTAWERGSSAAPERVELIPLGDRHFELRTTPYFEEGPPASAVEYELVTAGGATTARRVAPGALPD